MEKVYLNKELVVRRRLRGPPWMEAAVCTQIVCPVRFSVGPAVFQIRAVFFPCAKALSSRINPETSSGGPDLEEQCSELWKQKFFRLSSDRFSQDLIMK